MNSNHSKNHSGGEREALLGRAVEDEGYVLAKRPWAGAPYFILNLDSSTVVTDEAGLTLDEVEDWLTPR